MMNYLKKKKETILKSQSKKISNQFVTHFREKPRNRKNIVVILTKVLYVFLYKHDQVDYQSLRISENKIDCLKIRIRLILLLD